METNKNDKNYSTYGDVVTKDTLSREEKWELMNKKNKTSEDMRKLRLDDSLSSDRSTTGFCHEDRVKYNPNVEYFMLDYKIKSPPRWVRMGYLTQFELLNYLRGFVGNYTEFSGIRIHSERELDGKVKVECKDGEYRELTLRQILFDNRYDDYSDSVKDPKSDFLKSIYESRQPPEEDESNQ